MILNVSQKKVDPDITVIELQGRLTLGRECQRVEEMVFQLQSEGVLKLIMELKELNYIDSAGLGMLAVAAATLRSAGGDMRISSPTERVTTALKLTQLDRILPIYQDLEAACKGF
jgi:anti-sigma B factor antagonist